MKQNKIKALLIFYPKKAQKEDHGLSSWILRTNRQIQQYFIGLLILTMSLGCVRFLFPFQIINLNGNSIQISNASVLFTAGQIFGLIILGALIQSNQGRVLTGGGFLTILMLFMSIINNPLILMIIRVFEGIGYGLLFLGVISLAIQFPKREGEVLGCLFAAIFVGLAIGQGFAGIIWNLILSQSGLSSSQSIQLIAGLASIFTLLSTLIISRTEQSKSENERKEWKWPHFHLKTWVTTMFVVPSVALLLLIYALYDFAHGLYTPNLSILLTKQGISEIGVSLGYLVGDMTWGVSQLFAGRLIDRRGYYIPLILSFLLKGLTVVFYPEINFILGLFVLLMLAGLAEGFLEPARNKAALTVEMKQKYDHSHLHLNVGFSSSGGIVLGAHEHNHVHEFKVDSFVGALQTVGILFFGVGSLLGSWFLIEGYTLKDITFIGGFCLVVTSALSIVFSAYQKRKNGEIDN
ncbi:MAG: MFS transporter [Candidatus Hodarchaeales archaeon]|jgi:MFS family permease